MDPERPRRTDRALGRHPDRPLGPGVVQRALERAKVDDTLVPFVSSCIYYLIVAFVVVAALGMIGIQTASIIAVLAAAGLAIGLALQGTLANFAAGVMLLVFRPFRKGDLIEAAGVTAVVEAISIFTTTLSSLDNVAIVVPNAAVWGQIIRNYATNPTRRIDLAVNIAYRDSIQTALDAIRRSWPRIRACSKSRPPPSRLVSWAVQPSTSSSAPGAARTCTGTCDGT